MSSKYVIGLDYGTLSCRAVLARCKDGEIIADAVKPYTHQVMEELLPDGKTALEETGRWNIREIIWNPWRIRSGV